MSSDQHEDIILQPPPVSLPPDTQGVRLAADYTLWVHKEASEAKNPNEEAESANFVKLKQVDTIELHLNVLSSWTKLKQAVFRALVASREDIRLGPVLYKLKTKDALQWKACTFVLDCSITTYTLPAQFHKFSNIFNTSETQVSATIGLAVDYCSTKLLPPLNYPMLTSYTPYGVSRFDQAAPSPKLPHADILHTLRCLKPY
ncbi:hypothetical protein PCASD_18491 [Puccinia coronata f. sp. avenae]|uniref:Uncharacterized protein n=1 Tax=Puccinia coronata f. sp. avenae TaxID=200324 RepID=A0A2N5SVT3_9BASI|nr:hypothetical protein PCASD_18491 [Puccinia coronata f. sp. avenae]